MTSSNSSEEAKNQLRDNRDFPRLSVEAKVRIHSVALGDEMHAPAVVSDLSLGGARLATPAELQLDQQVQLIPLAGMDEAHPLYRPLTFTVVWQPASDNWQSPQDEWDYYGLRHQGSVLDILDSWLGHLLLRRQKSEDLVVQRRQHRRLRFSESEAHPLRAILSHDQSRCDLTLIDVGPGGLLARGDQDMPVGVHLEFEDGLLSGQGGENDVSMGGCVVDSHSYRGTTLYRVTFDPESELEEDQIVDWALRLGGTFE